MQKSVFSGVLMATAFVATSLFSTGSALAACTFSEWVNILPNQALPQINTRLCDAEMSVNVIGADPEGNTFDFGWSEATQSADSISSEFVDANASNQIQLDINRADNTMRMTIETTVQATGQSLTWYADYSLSRTYEE
ncbi:MAG TPA: hypothetical protein ENJ90_11940 [Devosia sp.]|nr:hypothetical protein [Devosia sp.]